jgi:hypothetical protein
MSRYTYMEHGGSPSTLDLAPYVRKAELHTLRGVCERVGIPRQSLSDHALLQNIRFILEPHVEER